ncbi:hypothetical protein [Azovibrio restrictus]|uniref:hypothetical protein n=1 Tax=Azovibrio restrictus TaxID=146938 RepID=UPI0026F048F2|nr:hypothetical protein [Azovibrio restrictus]MDD3483959.1 hypothetical protein [Azovibrio restrictus]
MPRRNYSNEDVTLILEQVLLHQCACPSQLCRMVLGLRELLQYERDCMDRSSTDVQVHQTIAQAAGQCLEIMETCLGQVLELEGWDPATLKMPAALQEHQLRLVSNDDTKGEH